MEYEEFLKTKQKKLIKSGFDVDEKDLNPALFPFQKHVVKIALKAGRYALFEECGLGKTIQQLEWSSKVIQHINMPVIILCPLAVSGQTIDEGAKFGYEVLDYIPTVENKIYISNFEQIHNIDFSVFGGVVIDESSILKNYEGATKKLIIDSLAHIPYKLACTATPSPNDPMELGNHSEFLGVMTRNEMLAMYFVHDGGETSKWRIKGHAEKSFYRFVGSWATLISNPRDIGYEIKGFDLPPLNLIEKQVITPNKDNGTMFNDVAVSATNFNSELRLTKLQRIDEVVKIIESKPNEPFIIWIKHNEEGELLRKLLPNSVEVKGNDDPDYKKDKLLGFAKGEFQILITKTKIASFGLNYQHCANQIFASLDFSFEALYQGIRRSYRFGQNKEVNIYMITTDTMTNVIKSINSKQKQFDKMKEEMSKTMNGIQNEELQTIQDNEEITTDFYHAKQGDCVQLVKEIPSESVGFTVFSPPFKDLYVYSDSIEDMGNCSSDEDFEFSFKCLAKENYRITMPGRNVAIHCMDLPIQKGKHGFIGLKDFSGEILRIMQSVGFIYHSRVTIWKDPVVEMQRTKALGLLHKQIKKDSTMSRVGIPDYVLIFRKDGERENPVNNTDLSVDLWQKYASPVWMDIDYGNTLQGFRNGRESSDERHICPLQLDTIERLIHLYTNEGDVVFTPFGGIGSEIYQAVKMKRKAIAFELKSSYFKLLKANAKAAEMSHSQIAIL